MAGESINEFLDRAEQAMLAGQACGAAAFTAAVAMGIALPPAALTAVGTLCGGLVLKNYTSLAARIADALNTLEGFANSLIPSGIFNPPAVTTVFTAQSLGRGPIDPPVPREFIDRVGPTFKPPTGWNTQVYPGIASSQS